MSVALVGSKKLNKRLAALLKKDEDVKKLYLCCMNYEETAKIAGERAVVVEEDEVYRLKTDVVVEDVGAERAAEVVKKALEADSHVVVTSSSVFSDKLFLREVESLSKEKKKFVVVPFGALPAMDLLEAMSLDSLKEVMIWVRRNPYQLSHILKEAGLDPGDVNLPVTVYEGSALKELIKVREDINTLMAAALVSKVDPAVKIIADKMVKNSEYKMKVVSEIGEVEVKAEYKVVDKISEIMIYSVYRAVKRLLRPWGVVVL